MMDKKRLNSVKEKVSALSYGDRLLIVWGMGEYGAFAARSLKLAENLRITAFTDHVLRGG